MKKLLLFVGVFGFASVLLTGCARNISGSTYSHQDVYNRAKEGYPGKIISVRKVVVKAGESLEDNKTGMLLGAVAGGLAGNMIGGGKGRVLATGIGALAGGAAGAYAEDSLKTQEAYEYVVQLDNGQVRTVVQGLDSLFAVGQRVILSEGDKGRARLIPF